MVRPADLHDGVYPTGDEAPPYSSTQCQSTRRSHVVISKATSVTLAPGGWGNNRPVRAVAFTGDSFESF